MDRKSATLAQFQRKPLPPREIVRGHSRGVVNHREATIRPAITEFPIRTRQNATEMKGHCAQQQT
jgi:hypothetical protein